MTGPLATTALTDEQKAQVIGILSIGCDRQTVADYVGCTLADIRRAMRGDRLFAAEIRRAEASVEVTHMRNVQELAKEKKDWRASVWWLERRSPERFARRSPGAVTARQLKEYLAILADVLQHGVRDAEDRSRVLARLESLADSVDHMLWESEWTASEVDGGEVNNESETSRPSAVEERDESQREHE
jgi:hypothetical protein